jgi:hypothetical protein
VCEACVVAFDKLRLSRGEDPEIALLVADTAIAFVRRFDFRQLYLVHEGFAMAIASVLAQLRFLLCGRGHVVFFSGRSQSNPSGQLLSETVS